MHEEDKEDMWNDDITLGEVKLALGDMKNKKAPQEEGIVIEFFERASSTTLDELISILNGLWQKSITAKD